MDLVPSDSSDTKWMVDWRPMVSAMLDELRRGCRLERIAARFHVGLADSDCSCCPSGWFASCRPDRRLFSEPAASLTRQATVGECRIHRL